MAAADDRDHGSIALELVVIFPVLILFLFLVVGAGQMVGARGDVTAAAQAGARAAAVARSEGQVVPRAREAAVASLQESGVCPPAGVDVEATRLDFRPGGSVTITVSCHVDLTGLSALGLFGDGGPTVSRSAGATFDRYRVVEGAQR